MSPKLSRELRRRLAALADRFENVEFLRDDPSQFMHGYTEQSDQEVVAFLSANLAFGRRTQILAHIRKILDAMHPKSPSEWILDGTFREFFQDSTRSFYRIYSHGCLRATCETLRTILLEDGSLGRCFERLPKSNPGDLAAEIARLFPKRCEPLVCHGQASANKRMNLFLRWMARDASPVDLGVWGWLPKTSLVMPLDTHVLATAKEFGLLKPNAAASLKTALELTSTMRQVFPDDPLKADFALFGYGVEKDAPGE